MVNIEKLAPVTVDLSKFSDAVKNDVVKKAVYEKLAAKVNNINPSAFVLKTEYQIDKQELEKTFLMQLILLKKAKLIELENKIADVSSLATKTTLTTLKNKIPDVGSLVKRQNKLWHKNQWAWKESC